MNPLMVSQGCRPRTGAILTCPECNRDFYASPCEIKRRKYCGRACKQKACSRQILKSCEVCGKDFTKAKCYGARFCSIKCYKISTKPRKQCKACGKELRLSARTYCSRECLFKDRLNGSFKSCEVCGKEMRVTPHLAESKRFCSRTCTNEAKKIDGPGCTVLRADGYISVYFPKHPDAVAGGTILQHRLVAEEKYGRRILKTEHVHHINGIRDDNRPENLEIVNPSAHQLISSQQGVQKRKSQREKLAEYEKRFGPLT